MLYPLSHRWYNRVSLQKLHEIPAIAMQIVLSSHMRIICMFLIRKPCAHVRTHTVAAATVTSEHISKVQVSLLSDKERARFLVKAHYTMTLALVAY